MKCPQIRSKLKTIYESTTAVNQAHLMRRLNTRTHFSIQWSTQSTSRCRIANLQWQMNAFVLLMRLPETWEALEVSLSNSASLTFDGVRGAILNEEICWKASEKSSGSANITRGRVQRSRRKSKEGKSPAFNVSVKGIKSPTVDFINKILKERKRKRKHNRKIHVVINNKQKEGGGKYGL